MPIKAFFVRLTAVLILAVTAFSCANIVPPAGGPKDVSHPKLQSSQPENNSRRFSSRQVKMVFDEYIKLSNLNQQLMISPPLAEIPVVVVRGKTLIINMPDSLLPATTYNFYFGNAVTDITEGNAIPNFRYVFSTGDVLDSLSVKGYVYAARDKKPVPDVYVMLFEMHDDSLPLTTIPSYVSKTDKQGYYELHNLRNLPYRMFALDDKNANMLFDMPNESFAFYDSLVWPEFLEDKRFKATSDTALQTDTLALDSLKADTITVADSVSEAPKNTIHNMYMFDEDAKKQRLIKKTLEKKGMVTLVFALPYTSVKLVYTGDFGGGKNIAEEFNLRSDTLHLWIKDTLRDSLFAFVYCNDTIIDTLGIGLVPRASKRSTAPKLTVTPSVQNNGEIDFFEQPEFILSTPLVRVDPEDVIFKADSLTLIPDFGFADSVKRKVVLRNKLDPGKQYELFIPQYTFTDIFGYPHDTLRLKFSTRKSDTYGKLILNVKLPVAGHPYILQLTDDKGRVVKEQTIPGTQKITFENMLPAKYGVKIIYDKNGDGRWTTGHYSSRRQPEKIYTAPTEISTRAGWDVEVEVIP